VLILGASGMLGHNLLFELLKRGLDVFGTVRDKESTIKSLPKECTERLIDSVDANRIDTIKNCICNIKPSVVINCIGIIKQLKEGGLALPCIEINAALPHKVYEICKDVGCRLIHYSTDCVFDGKKSTPYFETDQCTAKDYYGITKYLGELHYDNALTIRTSIIGNEIKNKLSLVEWFLRQENSVQGFNKVIYSGLPCTEHARILYEYILPNKSLKGLYQIASTPISKFNLLKLVALAYKKDLEIIENNTIVESKILSGNKFMKDTGYSVPDWETLIYQMYNSFVKFNKSLNDNK
jgi:dTDP-4-dehydrorhamnose reductase